MAWNTETLGDIADRGGGEIKTGPFGTQLHQSDYSQEGTPVVMPKNIIGGRVDVADIARVGSTHAERLADHHLQVGDIVYGRRGDIGRCALISEREAGWLCGTGCLKLNAGAGDVDPHFLFFFLNHPETIEWIFNQAVGATMPNLNTSILRSVPIRYPALPIQRRIAGILSAYDDLIEVNTRRIKALEEMARRTYEEWFVCYRFPGGDGTRPEEWEEQSVRDHIELAYGKALKAEDRIAGPVPVYGSSGVVGWHDVALVDGSGLILGRKGNVGSVHWSREPFYPIDTVFYVKTDLPIEFVFENLQRQHFQNSDAAVPGLNRNQAYSLPLIVPDGEMLDLYVSTVRPMYEMAHGIERQNTNLRTQRDLLLPRLVSGEIDVSEAIRPREMAAE